MKIFILVITLFCSISSAADNVLNIFVWANEIPASAIKQFEKETGIRVNLSTYDDNETLYAKLLASKHSDYDVIQPSNYYVDRMRRQNLLTKLDKKQLPNLKHLDTNFLNKAYDPNNTYSIPFTWTATGIFINRKYHVPQLYQHWKQLWGPHLKNQLLLLNDPREVFSMALISLGYSANDQHPQHLKLAYQKLRALSNNVKLYTSNTTDVVISGEDATLGMAWNGDVFRILPISPQLRFVYPSEGYVIAVDCLAIPKNAPHYHNAIRFINFMMRPAIAKRVSLQMGYATANLSALKLLPKSTQENPIFNPPASVLKHAQYQTDISDGALRLITHYWELLKVEA